MDQIIIKGNKPINGEIKISGSKNASLPIMAACLLCKGKMILHNIPNLADIITMNQLLSNHGSLIGFNGKKTPSSLGKTIVIDTYNINNLKAPFEIVSKMRASILVLGPLLARYNKVKIALPGGCSIGMRPIDIHIDSLKSMGADIKYDDGYINASCNGKLKGANLKFSVPSVGATENIMMAASLADGVTIIENAAKEPEIIDLACLLRKMGAKIFGDGTNKIEIHGVEELSATEYTVMPDRIEAGTYAIAAAITNGTVILKNIKLELIDNMVPYLLNAGVHLEETSNGVLVRRSSSNIKPVDIATDVYPGFSTDMQAQFMALMAIANGTSKVTENIFDNRFMHVKELNNLGSKISIDGNIANIEGIESYSGGDVVATDLRASVSLVLAGLAANGTTSISNIHHMDRGYEHLVDKLAACGADIFRQKIK